MSDVISAETLAQSKKVNPAVLAIEQAEYWNFTWYFCSSSKVWMMTFTQQETSVANFLIGSIKILVHVTTRKSQKESQSLRW